MGVLTLGGKAIDWTSPPKATDLVLWSGKTTSGKPVKGSFRTIAHLDHLDTLARKKYGKPVLVIQGPYNTGVKASAGTHDYDACLDVWISGVPGDEQQRFFRANGAGAYYRRPPTFPSHIHYFTLPPREGSDVSDDFRSAGFKVGKYVDGGWSTVGAKVSSSQIEDYYNHRTALAGHAHDPSWFPERIEDSIFNLSEYIQRQEPKPKPERLSIATLNVENLAKPPVKELLVSRNPSVVVIQQGGSAHEHLAAQSGYRLIGRVRGSEARGIKTLVRTGSKVARVKWLNTLLSWVGPKAGRKHSGRTYLAVKITNPFKVWVVNVHFPTGGPSGPNKAAWAESWAKIVAFSRRRARVVFVGDFNATIGEIEDLARTAGLSVHSVGKVDHAVSKGVEHLRTVKNIPGTPSGVHGWGSFTYEKEK